MRKISILLCITIFSIIFFISYKSVDPLISTSAIYENTLLNDHKTIIIDNYMPLINNNFQTEDDILSFVDEGKFYDAHITVSGEFKNENKVFSVNMAIPLTIFTDTSHTLFLKDSAFINKDLISIKQNNTEYDINAALYRIKSNTTVSDNTSSIMKAAPEVNLEIYLYGVSTKGTNTLKTYVNINAPLEIN